MMVVVVYCNTKESTTILFCRAEISELKLSV